MGLPCGRSGQIGAQIRRHVVHDSLEAKPLKGASEPIRELTICVKIERLTGNRGALHDLAFNGQHGAAACDLFLAFAQPVDAAEVRGDARQHITEPTRDLSRASPSMNSCRPLVTLLRPFGAREIIWLASFRFLTARTINRLFLAPLRCPASLHASLSSTNNLTNLPYGPTS
jgi:hypothetical protein